MTHALGAGGLLLVMLSVVATRTKENEIKTSNLQFIVSPSTNRLRIRAPAASRNNVKPIEDTRNESRCFSKCSSLALVKPDCGGHYGHGWWKRRARGGFGATGYLWFIGSSSVWHSGRRLFLAYSLQAFFLL